MNITVCQTMFLHTFDVSIKTVKSALTKNSPDKRGKHNNRIRLNEALIHSVKTHIKRFPVVESHYCRADTRRKYLNEDLSLAQMHRLYLMDHDKANPNTATLRQYRDIFNTYFNLGFFKPKKDQCSVCAEWKAFNGEEKLAHPEKAAEIADHVKKKQIVRKMKQQDKANSRDKEKNPGLSKMRVISFDLQKVFLTPRSEVGEFFYKRKLSSYNFTVFDCTVKEAYCYCWDQTIGGRGANEMASYIYDYILFLVSKGVTEIIIYSDSCSAQNKNQYLFSMYYWISIKHNLTIIHRYLEKGHTQMEADSVHGRIEKKIKHTDLYLPQQWYGFIKTARVKKPHYVVKEVTQKDVLNMKELGKYFQWSKVPITKIREIVFDTNSPPGSISFKNDLESDSIVVRILTKEPGRPVNWVTLQPPKAAYKEKIPLKKKLRDDLEWFLNKNYIPAAYIDRFRALIEYETHDELQSEEDDTPQEIIPEAHAIEALDAINYDSDPDAPEDAEVADHPGITACDNDSTDSEAYD